VPPSAAAPAAPEAAPAAASTATPPSAGQDQILFDPELQGTASPSEPAAAANSSAAPTSPSPAPTSGDAQVRAVLHTRFAADTWQQDPREDVYDSTTLATLEASVRRSEKLRFALGLRARYHVSALAHDVADASATQQAFDAVPTAAYADATLAPGLHLQVGYQPVHLGRFDVLTATNFLAVSDLRDGPATMPEGAAEVGQLAALIDYDVSTWLSLRAIYIPFFTPHLLTLSEGDYAIFPATQQQTAKAIRDAAGGAPGRITKLLRGNLSRDDRNAIATSGFDALSPEPTFTHPQGALRATAHGPAGEIALTLGTALERMPTLQPSSSFVNYAYDQSMENQAFLGGAPHPLIVHHDRFFVASTDAATDIGPITVGAELAFMKNRTLYAWRKGGENEGLPNATHADLAHLGVRAEYTASDEWLAALEGFAAYAFGAPSDGTCQKPQSLVDANTKFSDCRYMLLEGQHWLRGAAALASFSPADTGLHFELGAALVTGPSLVLTPRIGYAPWPELEVEVGALFVEGPAPSTTNMAAVAVGTIYDHVDQVFLGVRYLP
jgi:hypothetical protein